MARLIADYLALSLIARMERDDDPFSYSGFASKDFSGDFEQLKAHTVQRCGFNFRDDMLRDMIRSLADCGLVRVTDDPYSGTFYKIRATGFSDFVERARNEISNAVNDGASQEAILTMKSDFPNAWALLSHQIFDDYAELGNDWFSRALEGLSKQAEIGELPKEAGVRAVAGVPAADRVVTLEDNQQSEIEAASADVITALEHENAIDGDPTLRDRFLGQLKAGRELIRAKTLSAYLLYQTVFDVLSALVTKYKGQTIELAAKKLLELLIDRIFGK